MSQDLNSADREPEIRATIHTKPALKAWYLEQYRKFKEVLSRSPKNGVTLELGSGASFIKDVLPEITTSDVIPYPGVDCVVDATQLPFQNGQLRAVFLMNVLHHIPDPEAFFRELVRTLSPGGRCLIIDQSRGIPSRWILRFGHHEPYRPDASEWAFPSSGPLSGANGALLWIVFFRDRKRFESLFPQLQIRRCTPHSPLRYWLTGGMKSWSLLPKILYPFATLLDQVLVRCLPISGSFIDIELERT